MTGDTTTEPSGIGMTFASLASLGGAAVPEIAVAAASMGYDSVWTAETVGLEAFATLAAAGASAPEVGLGTGVLALQLRTPMVAAMGAATLQSLHPERDVWLGVGISSPVVTERWHGVEYGASPIARTREYLELVRSCLSGEAVSHEGEYYRCSRFRLGVRLGDRRPRLVLGALNPTMLRLAGEAADGVLLNYLPASAVPWCVERVREGEQAAGRPAGACQVIAYVHVTAGDRETAVDAARKDLFSYAVVDAYATAFARAGFEGEVERLRAARASGDRDGAVAAMSDTMVDAINVIGDDDHVAATVAAYVHAGVDLPVVMAMPWGADRRATTMRTLEAARRGVG
ncbi:MAG TPA: LLM class F420-dependent oxidoreductase [Microthrixaceae bacterium]|nr:LLM class F420-dependent oxidoreductase [Microthrixaceae bacterium]